MNQDRSEQLESGRWHVPVAVEEIPEGGRHFALTADAPLRAALARMAGLRELSRLEAAFQVSQHGADGVRVVGRVSASVKQTCVVTLEPVDNEVTEDVDVLFLPQSADLGIGATDGGARDAKWDDPEPLVDGIIDLGALATEFLVLGLDPYPRQPGAVFEPPPAARAEASPFAALAGWTKVRDDS